MSAKKAFHHLGDRQLGLWMLGCCALLVIVAFFVTDSINGGMEMKSNGDVSNRVKTDPTPKDTPPTTASVACADVLAVLEQKLVPASTAGARGKPSVAHLAFIGDNATFHQYRFAAIDMDQCLPASATRSLAAAHLSSATVPANAVASFTSTFGETQTKFVLTFHEVRYVTAAAKLLGDLYAAGPGADKRAADLKLASWKDTPPPVSVFSSTGMWDVAEPDVKFDGFSHEVDWFAAKAPKKIWGNVLVELEARLRDSLTNSLQSLLRTWKTPTDAKAKPMAAPLYFHVGLPNVPNCSAPRFNVAGGAVAAAPPDRHLQGYVRCATLLYPVMGMIRSHLIEAMSGYKPEPGAPLVRTLDSYVYKSQCTISDGYQLDAQEPRCRTRISEAFWGLY